ncbi:MAG TPA: septum site-determining protein MinC [Alphaproteobacteria bacterium]|nr:septum site-determining protein MinC [Alphaproteobacteria bacterium]
MSIAGPALQGALVTVMVVKVSDDWRSALPDFLAGHIGRNPTFFQNAPVVLEVGEARGCATRDDFRQLKELVRGHGLMPIGIQGGSELQRRAALESELPSFPAAGRREAAPRTAEAAPAPAQAKKVDPAEAEQRAATAGRTRVVTQPVRSGSQVYAQGGDLIVMAAVSPGAEVIADGHVHIYGALRGRAIAGASGDTEARIFTHSLEAELICIAGNYLVSDSIDPQYLKRPVQISLAEDRLIISEN